MFFEKPNMRYVDMCIYIDDNIYTDSYSAELVYQYLYHIIMMICIKIGYFTNRKVTEDFSLYASSVYYMRLTDKRQFEDGSELEPIRSILNYVKRTLFSIKREYCKKHLLEQELPEMEFISIDNEAFSVYVNNKIDGLGKIEFDSCLGSIKDIIKDYLKSIPYSYGTTMWNNIYISCMLSFLNSITLRNRDIKRIKEFKRPNSLNDTLLNKLYLKERRDSTILYHLDSNMHNYITVLTNRLRHKLSNDLSQSLHTYTPSCVCMKNLLMSNILEEQE